MGSSYVYLCYMALRVHLVSNQYLCDLHANYMPNVHNVYNVRDVGMYE